MNALAAILYLFHTQEQENSHEAQVDYFTDYIKQREDWEFVKVYTDEGVKGMSTRRREGFNEMIADALVGRIDLIVTKSVSRFARNTVDSLTTIRELKAHSVQVYFQKENIYTFDGKSELLLTITSSLAPEESRSISENVTWDIRKSFSDGKVSMNYKSFLVYRRGEDDTPEIVQEEAEIMQTVYRRFLEGNTVHEIARDLTAAGIPTPMKRKTCCETTVQSILTKPDIFDLRQRHRRPDRQKPLESSISDMLPLCLTVFSFFTVSHRGSISTQFLAGLFLVYTFFLEYGAWLDYTDI